MLGGYMGLYSVDAVRKICKEHFKAEYEAEAKQYKQQLAQQQKLVKQHEVAMQAHAQAMARHQEDMRAWKSSRNFFGQTKLPKPAAPVAPPAPVAPQPPQSIEAKMKPWIDRIEGINKLRALRNDYSAAPSPQTFEEVMLICLTLH